MKIRDIKLLPLKIPFKVSFKHASAERAETETIIAIATSDSGITGYGEGCPRKYVTGETIQSAQLFFEKHLDDVTKTDSLPMLRQYAQEHRQHIDQNPAAWCAIETALLDLWGQHSNAPIEELLSLPRLSGDFHYTAILGISAPEVFQAQLLKYLKIGFKQFKVKISGDLSVDQQGLQLIHEESTGTATIRIDANNLWTDVQQAADYIRQLHVPMIGIEEPLQARDYEGMRNLAQQTGCPIILDESFTKMADFDAIQADPDHWILNIRVSKMGGLIRSLDIADTCEKRNQKFVIGAQVGETSILTRAALCLASNDRDLLIGQEGAFGEHLLAQDPFSPCIMFGAGGCLSSESFAHSAGLGLKANNFFEESIGP